MNALTISVDCTFWSDGTIHIRRIECNDRWQAVGQGRQWQDTQGRHILVMLGDDDVREIILRPDTLTWEMKSLPGRARLV